MAVPVYKDDESEDDDDVTDRKRKSRKPNRRKRRIALMACLANRKASTQGDQKFGDREAAIIRECFK